jgi:NADH-quinone oxidoreductase subunit L
MREMGGLRSKMPITFLTMFIATLAIAGVPGFSGFVSKDRILGDALAYGMTHPSQMWIPVLGFITAGLTAFYMFRLIFMTFFGHARDEHKHHHAHESPITMTFPLMVLAALSFAIVFAGPTGIHSVDANLLPIHWFDHALDHVKTEMGVQGLHASEEVEHHAHSLAMIVSLVVAGLGIFLSALTYLKKVISAAAFEKALKPIHTLLWNKYYFDDLYIKVIIQKLFLPATVLMAKFDDKIVDGIFVDGWAKVAMVLKSVIGKFDDVVVDKLAVDGSGTLVSAGGWVLRQFQTGKVQQYLILTFIVFGMLLFYMTR